MSIITVTVPHIRGLKYRWFWFVNLQTLSVDLVECVQTPTDLPHRWSHPTTHEYYNVGERLFDHYDYAADDLLPECDAQIELATRAKTEIVANRPGIAQANAAIFAERING